jgi:GTPase SAR1 family protein
MGVTGVGKSTFINHFSDEATIVGHGLEACKLTVTIIDSIGSTNKTIVGTGKVEIYPSTLPDGTKLFLVDTPGFDDTYRSDTDILKEIADWLSSAYEEKIKLAGIVYLHRIEDVRLGGAAMRNLRMFKALCGDNSLASVVLATTRWRNVDPDEGALREEQLCNSPKMWKRMIDFGSKVMRQDRDEESACEIIQYLLARRKPVTLDIQVELVDNKKTLNETGAGQELHAELEKQKKQYEKQLAELRKEMEDAMAKMNEDLKEQLQAEKEDLERRLQEAREHDRQLDATREEIRQQMALEAQRERNELQEQLRQAERQVAREESRLEQQKERYKYELQQSKLAVELQQKKDENAVLRMRLKDEESSCVMM